MKLKNSWIDKSIYTRGNTRRCSWTFMIPFLSKKMILENAIRELHNFSHVSFFTLNTGIVDLHLPGKGKISKVCVKLKIKIIIWMKNRRKRHDPKSMWLDKHIQGIINEPSSSRYPLSLMYMFWFFLFLPFLWLVHSETLSEHILSFHTFVHTFKPENKSLQQSSLFFKE